MLNKGDKNSGQALVEFTIVAAGAVTFLILFLPIMSKVSEARFKTLQAARYAAWERTIYYDKTAWADAPGISKSELQLRDEANQRILAQGKDFIGIKYSGSLPIDKFLYFQKHNKLLGSYEEFMVNHNSDKSGVPSYLSLREQNLNAPSLGIDLNGKSLELANLPNLPSNGFYSDYVMIELKSLGWWKEFDQILAPEDTNVILADGWSAGTGVSLQQKIQEGVEIGINNAIVDGFNALAPILTGACIGIGIKCGRDFENDRLTKTSTLPQYVPQQRLE